MPNSKAAKKALRVNDRKNIINKARKTRVRTFIKKTEKAISEKNTDLARNNFKKLESEIMKSVTKNIFKFNTAVRKLKRLAASIRKITPNSKKDIQDNKAVN